MLFRCLGGHSALPRVPEDEQLVKVIRRSKSRGGRDYPTIANFVRCCTSESCRVRIWRVRVIRRSRMTAGVCQSIGTRLEEKLNEGVSQSEKQQAFTFGNDRQVALSLSHPHDLQSRSGDLHKRAQAATSRYAADLNGKTDSKRPQSDWCGSITNVTRWHSLFGDAASFAPRIWQGLGSDEPYRPLL